LTWDDKASKQNNEINNGGNIEQNSLFGGLVDEPKARLTLQKADEATMENKLLWEKELLGLYVSGHPLDKYEDKIQKSGNTVKSMLEKKDNKKGILIAHIDSIKNITTKKTNYLCKYMKFKYG